MARKPIPNSLQQQIIYDSQWVCAICQQSGGQIHHIDGDHSNNTEANLVFLCAKHHDEAHTTRTMSRNLSKSALAYAKKEWNRQVAEKRIASATAANQPTSPLFSQATWGYINHQRVITLSDLASINDRSTFLDCQRAGLVDGNGIIIKPKNSEPSESYIGGSVYDWFEYGDDHRLHLFYSALVDQIVVAHPPIHLEREHWSKRAVKALLHSGSFLFLNVGYYFKTVSESRDNQHRRAFYRKRNIEFEFFLDTRDMFGTTSMTVSFSGHQKAAALLLIKSINEDEGVTKVACTPLALGIGFHDPRLFD